MGLSRTFSEINGDFSQKSKIPIYFSSPLTGFPLELGIGARSQKLTWEGYQMVQKV